MTNKHKSLVDPQDWEKNKEIIVDAAHKAGCDVSTLVKIMGLESQFIETNRAIETAPSKKHLNRVKQFDGVMAKSSAYGLGQMEDPAWHDAVNKYGEKYGIQGASHMNKTQVNSIALRTNVVLQAELAAELTKHNINKGKEYGGNNNIANVYILHNLGGRGGAHFLNALKDHPNEPISTVISQSAIENNPRLYGHGTRTIAQQYEVFGGIFKDYQKYADEAVKIDQQKYGKQQTPPDATHKKPSAHAQKLHVQIENLCRAKAKECGFNWGQDMVNTAHALTVVALQNNFKHVTHLTLSDGNKNINIGDLSSDRHLYAKVNANAAAEMEATKSLDIINKISQTIAQTNEQEKINQQTQQPTPTQTHGGHTIKA